LREPGARRFGISELPAWAEAQGISLGSTQARQLAAYLDTLLLWAKRVDLVSQSDPDVIVAKHFADSLVPARFCPEDGAIADIGSGAGFPGLVLAIALPKASVRVIESRAKRASFLAEVVRVAKIENAAVSHARAEDLAGEDDHRQAYDVVFSRALGTLDEFISLARPLLRPSGKVLAMKGPRFAEELDSLGDQRSSCELTHRYRLPDGSERALLRIRCA
jgi:16S rRNA (guanine527-N7)-methyltransferase